MFIVKWGRAGRRTKEGVEKKITHLHVSVNWDWVRGGRGCADWDWGVDEGPKSSSAEFKLKFSHDCLALFPVLPQGQWVGGGEGRRGGGGQLSFEAPMV